MSNHKFYSQTHREQQQPELLCAQLKFLSHDLLQLHLLLMGKSHRQNQSSGAKKAVLPEGS